MSTSISQPLKPALTYNQQIERLKVIHKLTISDDALALRILAQVNYYRLSAYGIGLKKASNPEEYRDDITLEHIFRLYCFDSEFRNNIIHIVEQLEIMLRTRISYYLGITYGPEGYTDVRNFIDKQDRQGQSIHSKIMESLKREIQHNKNLPLVKHHLETYGGHFPIWVAVEIMTFGNIASLFDIMKTEDKKEISILFGTSPSHLKSWILALVEIRNICAHYNRLYNMPLKQTPFLYRENRKYRNEQNKVFPTVLVIKRMLCANEQWESFLKDINKTMNKYRDVVVLSFIGFPSEWYEILSAPLINK
jgi:abortive infection bacteriophage resistance protein